MGGCGGVVRLRRKLAQRGKNLPGAAHLLVVTNRTHPMFEPHIVSGQRLACDRNSFRRPTRKKDLHS
ncbi:hypothetical protein BN381_150031 [Candidatus Microthrix parvicella RN1]|uniref:Uncharacterized protein n=1 Tax=Candidatus Neomicrothrix parvicella RN1 TaxID=1229780 RepID=R4YXH3_9ACTN|nr:hypothetical protein BN381_150031 [Candidatus Microthrix parvicella RN1]